MNNGNLISTMAKHYITINESSRSRPLSLLFVMNSSKGNAILETSVVPSVIRGFIFGASNFLVKYLN